MLRPDDGRIAVEVSLPEPVTQHNYAFRFLPGRRIGWNQPAPQQRGHRPVVGSVGRDITSHDIFRKVAIGGGEIPSILPDGAFDGLRLPNLFQLCAVPPRKAILAGLVLEAELRHSVRAAIGERVNQDRIMTLKTAVVAPTPSASDSTAVRVNPGPPPHFPRGILQIGRK
jgi:hypothetical protein